MKRSYQLSFGPDFKTPVVHGGELSFGKRKVKRPIHTKKPMHVTLRAECAIGRLSLRLARNRQFIESKIKAYAERWGIRIYGFSINSNHIHLNVRARTRIGFQNFLRTLSAQVATFVTGARKGKALDKRFWDLLAWSRVAEWGSSFRAVKSYVHKNVLEAAGLIPYTKRTRAGALARGKTRPTRPAHTVESTFSGLRGRPVRTG